jgi:N-acetylmuramoyl-L-alanine amidase
MKHRGIRFGGSGRGNMLAAGIWGLFALACASPGSSPPQPDAGPDYRVSVPSGRDGRVPIWAGRPLTWDKLGLVSDWLQNSGTRADDYWVVEGHLQLAEGRLHYALLEPKLEASRTVAASAGFQRVLAHPRSTSSQRQRAELGLNSLGGVGRGESTPAGGLPGVLARSAWGARRPNTSRMDLARAPWAWITVHHSAEPGAAPLNGSLADTARALRDIQSAHMNGPENMGDIGYHFLIDPSGRVLQGRDLRFRGAHAYRANNIGNVGICLIGNFEHERPTKAAVEAMHGLIDVLRSQLHVPANHIRGHDEWRVTACPGRYLRPHLARYK